MRPKTYATTNTTAGAIGGFGASVPRARSFISHAGGWDVGLPAWGRSLMKSAVGVCADYAGGSKSRIGRHQLWARAY